LISGKDAGKRGKVLKVLREKGRVVVQGVNFIKRHTKARAAGKESGILEKEAPLHISKVALWDAKANKGSRVGLRRSKDGKSRERVSRSTGEVLG